MSNAQNQNPQSQNQQPQKDQYSSQGNSNNQSSTGKVGSNISKDEPTAEKRTGGMKDEANTSGSASSPKNQSNA